MVNGPFLYIETAVSCVSPEEMDLKCTPQFCRLKKTTCKFDVIYGAAFFIVLVYVIRNHWPYFVVTFLAYCALRLSFGTNFRKTIDIGKKCILITGCDTGFGHHLAKRLDDRGYTVIAGVLDGKSEGAQTLQSRLSDKLHVVKLDVTKDDDVSRLFEYIEEKNQGLWGVVNNAGINFPGDVELVTLDQFMRCADVNLFGMIRVIKAALPLVRKAKGRIVNVSSVKGRYSYPGDSVYVVTKHGIETMSDSLRLEMKKFGVKVSIIEPGRFNGATSILGPEQLKRIKKEIDYMWQKASDDVKRTYGRTYFDNIYNQKEKATNGYRTLSADPVLNAIEDALVNVNPQARYLIGGSFDIIDRSVVLAKVYNFLPEWFSDWIIQKMTGCASFPE